MKLKGDIELFDSYLRNALDEVSRRTFEQRMEADEDFRRDFEDYQTAVNVIKAAAAGQHVRSLMTNDRGRVVGLPRFTFAIGLSIAASVVLLITFFLWPAGKPSPEELFEEHFLPYPNILASRSGSRGDLYTALEEYAIGNYAKAVALMKDVPLKSDTLYFYTGVSSLTLKNTGDAIAALEHVDENSVFHQQVNWYQGLAYLLQGEAEKAKRLLAKIGPSEYKYQEAQSILASL